MTPLAAVLWDFDGTLADTRERNYRVARRILADLTGNPPDAIPALRSRAVYDSTVRRYANWRELYRVEFGLSDDAIDRAGAMWSTYQLADGTPIGVFDGIAAALEALSTVPHGIVSMNARDQIARTVNGAGVGHHFRTIVGYEEVHIRRQKPEPDGLLLCLEQVSALTSGRVLYVGDHETDVRCAANANAELRRRGAAVRVVAVAARFTGDAEHEEWSVRPDYAVAHPQEIVAIAAGIGHGSV